MQKLDVKKKVAKMIPFLQAAKLLPDPVPCEVGPKLTRIIEAAGDRLKVMGDILNYADFFFVKDEELIYDEQDFAKRVSPPQSQDLLEKFRAGADELRAKAPRRSEAPTTAGHRIPRVVSRRRSESAAALHAAGEERHHRRATAPAVRGRTARLGDGDVFKPWHS